MEPASSRPASAHAVLRAPSPQGIHARPAARIVEAARRYEAETVLAVGTSTARAKDLLDVLALAATGGVEVRVEASGRDADAAVAALVTLFDVMAAGG
ncbi:MAG: HPr family phosphocarrier protein [Planctomycetes bacterium]|nr:HPr family phosphocarrier protein [Planctomycetota bacterium]